MDWEELSISLYLRICKEYQEYLWINCQRFTNGGHKYFTDEEAILIYLIGILRGFKTIKSIHRYASDHLRDWFPGLPQYAGFVHRINHLSEAFRLLIERLQSDKVPSDDDGIYLIDSMPIILARNQHAYTAKVASELASKSYNSTKKMYYYGIKAHIVARKREGKLPDLDILILEEAARQDGSVFKQIRPELHDNLVFADQAYKSSDADQIEMKQNLKVFTPVTKARGQKKLEPQQKKFSKVVSRIRQPIETLFRWIQRITGIQDAGLVRSAKGLMTHVFGRFAAAMMKIIYPLADF